ncbi:MAG: hypothetical protein PVJ57_08905 [Phycisphaerae bacterium]|jgi:hypothetical protein
MKTETPEKKDSPPPFDEHTVDAVGRIRRTFTEIIAALPQSITRASELQHTLKIDKGLSWRIFNVIRYPNPFDAARYIPGTGGVRIFLRAAKKQGVPVALTETAAAALADYDNLVRIHAGSRRRLDRMLAAHSDEGRAEMDLAHRRLAYEANSYIWGVSAEAQLRASFVNFSKTPGRVDHAAMRGLVGVQRLRPDVRWPLGLARCRTDSGVVPSDAPFEPLYDVENPDDVAAKLFMSQPRPKLEYSHVAESLQWTLSPGRAGKTGAVTCITGEIVRRGGSYYCCETDSSASYVAQVGTASELLIFDQFVHEELYGRLEPELVIYSNFASGPYNSSIRLPLTDTVQYMGKATDALHTPEVPRYADMVSYVFERLGWEPQRFDVYRFRMEYPIIQSEVRMSNRLRPAPTDADGRLPGDDQPSE